MDDPQVLRIECDTCVMQDTPACDDCIVTFLCGERGSAVVLAHDEVRALRLLSDGGLVPCLRHQSRKARR
jgi:hypothetical protein